MVAAFAAAPVAAGQITKVTGTARFGTVAGGVEGNDGLFVFVEGGGALNDDQSTRSGQPGLQGLEGIDFYVTLVAASMAGVRLFCVGKRGVALDFSKAAL